MSKKKKRFWVRTSILAVFAALLGFAIYQTVLNDRADVLQESEQAPDFTLQTLEGERVDLSDYRGQGVLINFWATWCEPCKAEMPAIEQMYQIYGDQGFTVLAVNTGESELSINGFVRNYGLSFPILLDQEKKVTNDLYRIGPLPSSIFVEPNGTINKIVIGEMNSAMIEQYILQTISGS